MGVEGKHKRAHKHPPLHTHVIQKLMDYLCEVLGSALGRIHLSGRDLGKFHWSGRV